MKLTLIKSSDKKLSEAFINDEKLVEAEEDNNTEEVVNDEETTTTDDDNYSNFIDTSNDEGSENTNDVEPNMDTAPVENTEPTPIINDDNNNDTNNEVIVNNFNGLVNQLWGTIDQLKGTKAFIETETFLVNNKDSINNLIEDLIDDLTIDIGVVYKLIELANPKVSLLINKGQNKASEKILDTTTDGVDDLSTL